MRWRIFLIPTLALLALGSFLANCAREPRFRAPKLGEVVEIKPVAVNYLLAPAVATHKAIKLNAMWGGRAISSDKGNPTLNFYRANGSLKMSRKWADLTDSYRVTGCSDEQIASLDGYLMGAALICDGSLDLSDVHKIEAVDDTGEKRASTSWGVYRVSEQVSGVSLGFY